MKTLTEDILYRVINKRPQESHKGTYGRVLIIGGTTQFGGAVIMNALATVNSGAGLVTVATDSSNFTALHCHLPEAMVVDFNEDLTDYIKKSDVILIGSGLGNRVDIVQHTFYTVTPHQILIVDGSALTLVAEHKLKWPKSQLILTPHQMEWQRLSGVTINEQAFEAFNMLAQHRMNIEPIVVLKQHHTQIYTQHSVFQIPVGGPYQATGGMGDTLAGMIAGFTAQFMFSTSDSVLAAVYAHSAIADELSKTQYVTLPTKISAAIPEFMHHYAK
ncbi:ADP-dependent (S)-NAD(P)H-hydrate dehydratase [Leuconostoc litchii]|uniref:ADP-dependent (S)-NAD(P)H-hydrate dehydratase n=1 Tax=Leuconostoc litchii TaxID=1981069 RepID=A0A6P2CL11_9LACO|nr:NAD(P)H-hydrate dehydratase [Leuconostoc litchii]TYC46566.1 NAD(P)H-hydrate dehydratase [Leuconostoc litchii]GMA70416.1 ADP-dependent (S)-NAD(P)H-hydrate dehydratase [Leuconostoc litchii]